MHSMRYAAASDEAHAAVSKIKELCRALTAGLPHRELDG